MDGDIFKKWDNDHKSAGILIHLYTNVDENEQLPNVTLHHSLNHQLRGDNPGIIWREYENLLNRALSIIGKETFEYLFRGERCCKFSVADEVLEGSSFVVHGFWSTTLDPYQTAFFGGDEHAFYIIKNAEGVKIQHISVTDVEKEVLIESSTKYRLERKISDKKEKNEMLKQIEQLYPNSSLSSSIFPEKIFVVVSLKSDQEKDEL